MLMMLQTERVQVEDMLTNPLLFFFFFFFFFFPLSLIPSKMGGETIVILTFHLPPLMRMKEKSSKKNRNHENHCWKGLILHVAECITIYRNNKTFCIFYFLIW